MSDLRDFTTARVSLGTAGVSMPTQAVLQLRMAHAKARDAVHVALDPLSLTRDFAQRGWSTLVLHSEARTRDEYLRRPDRGRRLDAVSLAKLKDTGTHCRVCFVVADGLSALAIHRHAAPFLDLVLPTLNPVESLFIVEQGRVAIGDSIGELVAADVSIVLIGERPGLSSPDSLGIYLTWQPRTGRTDAERNCISNIHGDGLSYRMAAHKLQFLINEAVRRQLSGVALKELAGNPLLPTL